MSGFPLTNLMVYAVVAVTPVMVFWAALRLVAFAQTVRRTTPAMPHPPIERLAADLRRVRRTLADFEEGTPVVRRRGARQAYDALLIQACVALDVEHTLDRLPEGIEREMERLRVEESLRSAGLFIH
ncbi:hypothetical protein SAMN05421810_101662 [Amycolatopsis arida]|uniref:Uncharacterized protein n=1 Tax=Amycolatopsis arida TaxID=587909 RepID=A0A1I5LTR4_9PSEU|nr:hypothetical protein CLV69_104295 [Amycolatopsis arida]SFP00527.1 hypothetical protein SAMN05421810_101662 [Amycolatopsis arida]